MYYSIVVTHLQLFSPHFSGWDLIGFGSASVLTSAHETVLSWTFYDDKRVIIVLTIEIEMFTVCLFFSCAVMGGYGGPLLHTAILIKLQGRR